MAAIVGIDSRCGHTIEVYHGNHPNKTKLTKYMTFIHFKNCLKWLYISNKMEHYSYKVVVAYEY